tara:strand:+ start:1758 stop:2747 length:990 start_codon:yes stop_codon:yes gene_type:complete
MKDLVLISSHCNTKLKEQTLRNLVNQISTHENYFDIMVVSHTIIPLDIQDKCNYTYYDKDNELLYDWDLRSKPWFDPNNQRPILSIFTGEFNTHLAAWRIIIMGNSIAKSLGYKKVHHFEYDIILNDPSELYDNSKLLDTHDVIFYNKTENTVSDILFGTYQAYRLDTLHTELLVLDREKLKSQIRKSKTKSPEGMLQSLLTENRKFKCKPKSSLDTNGNFFGLSHNGQTSTAWCLPYYDKLTDTLEFIVWNMEGLSDIDVTIVYNKNHVTDFGSIPPKQWRSHSLGKYDDANTLMVLLNNKIRDIYNFDSYREKFKLNSYREINKRVI